MHLSQKSGVPVEMHSKDFLWLSRILGHNEKLNLLSASADMREERLTETKAEKNDFLVRLNHY